MPLRGSRRRAWVLVAFLLLINGMVASLLLAPEARTRVSYTFLLSQVQVANVAELASAGETIEGEFRRPAAYTPPGEAKSEQVVRFTTQRPSFADDNLFAMLQANGVPVNARLLDGPPPLWLWLLAGLGPALLLGGGLLLWSGRRAPAA
jgi:cell division protease FtsH